MLQDPYASCPCGSGKKTKWCCGPIYGAVDHAWQLENSGQHDAAVKAMEQVTRDHAGNPEAWGQLATLYAVHEKTDQAEEALERAFALNANYAAGLKLRAHLRLAEREYHGALLLARRAAEAYDPAANDALAEVFSLIFDGEMRANRPLAARAALARAVHLKPGEEELRQAMASVFGPGGRFPASACRPLEFKKPADGVTGPRRQAWNRALGGATPRLSEVAQAFEELTKEDATDAAAWYNLGLTRAWLGDNPAALAAMNRYVELETDEAAAVDAATLAEILRFGKGMEDHGDYQEYSFLFQMTDPQPVQKLLTEWYETKRLLQIPTQQEGLFAAMLLEVSQTGLVAVGRPAAEVGNVVGMLTIIGPIFRVASVVKERFDRIKEEVRQKLALGLTALREARDAAQFSEVVTEGLGMPLLATEDAARERLVHETASRFYETTWIHRPLKSLNNIAPIDAAGHPVLKRRLQGVIRVIEECGSKGLLGTFSFDGLRRKLGLASGAPAEAGLGLAAMGAAELSEMAGRAVDGLTDEQLEQAFQVANRLDVQEAAARFATALTARPVTAGKGDRYPWYSFVIQKAVREGEYDAALERLEAGEKSDAEHNEGKRRTEYEVFRAQVLTRKGDAAGATAVYEQLLARVPADLTVRGKAVEAMLGMKQGGKALALAEEGMKLAQQAKDRGAEEHFRELVAAARKISG